MSNSVKTTCMILGGLLSATLSLLHLFPVPGLIFISYLATLPLFLVGLGLGLRSLYGASLIATLLIILLEGPLLGGEFFIFSALGSTFLINRALLNRKKASGQIDWYPASLLLRDITLAAGLVMVIALGVYLYFTQGGDAHALIKSFLKAFDPQNHLKDAESLLNTIFPFLPGFFSFSWTLMMLINAALAQGLLIRFNHNLRPSPSLVGLKTPKSFLLLLFLSLLLSMIGIGSLALLGKNAVLILLVPFFLVGLGVIHEWIHKMPFVTAGLTLFYALMFLFIWPIFGVILIGILKPWIEKFTSLN
ncbi:MAG: DUF2232 domain-containing protein [Proteobacteria bacterium]|nr:DUF2232 domain-containing protein [Pseudomonadota bacterium]